jgi:glutamyl endopeptidase
MTTKRTSKKAKKTPALSKRGVPKKTVKRTSVAGKKKKRPSKSATKAQVSQPKLPRLPKDGPRDIALLSFGKKPIKKRIRPLAAGELGFGLAASAADRQQVADTHVSPFRKICDLLITAADGTLHSGTGWFISPRVLVTAGHCIAVFRPGTSIHGMVNKILVMPARHGETEASDSFFGWVEVESENLRVHERWFEDGDLDFDYGAIILPPDQALGETVGFIRFRNFPDQQLNGAIPTLAGYPDNVPEGTQWFETNAIRRVEGSRLFYDIFTIEGQSGSPVFFANNAQQIACAIHNLGDAPFNSGVRITPSVIDQLNSWIAETQ